MNPNWKGIFVILQTPFDEHGEFDEESGMIAGVSYATPPGDVEQYNHAPTGGLYPWGHGPALLAAVSLLQETNGANFQTESPIT